jgi:hypothetical protein
MFVVWCAVGAEVPATRSVLETESRDIAWMSRLPGFEQD